MRSGELRHRITFKVNTPTVNSFGEYVDTYADSITVWGADRPLSGTRLFQAQQLNSDVKGEVEIRYRSDIEASMKMVIDSRTLEILSIINPSQRNEKLLIMYKEVLDK
jgi:SPP1 family predicted phage head-tail adaptor